jgi:choline dehydrogenase-like flavoprotein
MEKADDPQAVVDSKARVYGFRGLRVVDASIFPILPLGHPRSTCYLVAEKIAGEILKEDRTERCSMWPSIEAVRLGTSGGLNTLLHLGLQKWEVGLL